MGKVTPPPSAADSGNATMGVDVAVIALAVITCALRFYTRVFTKAGLGWDDWLILSAVLMTLLTAGLTLWSNSIDPNGQWVSDNTDASYIYTSEDQFYLKLSYVTSVLYFQISGATKVGICFMYGRIFSVNKSFRQQLWIAGSLVASWWFGCTIANLTNCIPLQWSWINGLADPRYCFNYNIFWMAAGACEILLDVLIISLPVRMVTKLHLSAKKKATVTGIFLLGGFTIITGLVKVILGYPPGSRVPSYSKTEVWTTVHTGMSIVCASLPIFKPLITRVASSALITKLGTFSGSSSGGTSGSRSWTIVGGGGSGSGSGGSRNRARRRRNSSATAEEPFTAVAMEEGLAQKEEVIHADGAIEARAPQVSAQIFDVIELTQLPQGSAEYNTTHSAKGAKPDSQEKITVTTKEVPASRESGAELAQRLTGSLDRGYSYGTELSIGVSSVSSGSTRGVEITPSRDSSG